MKNNNNNISGNDRGNTWRKFLLKLKRWSCLMIFGSLDRNDSLSHVFIKIV